MHELAIVLRTTNVDVVLFLGRGEVSFYAVVLNKVREFVAIYKDLLRYPQSTYILKL